MASVRRWYIYLVTTIALQAVTWSVITLLRGLVGGGQRPVEVVAFNLATIIVGLPLYLAHWLWAQRLAARVSEERASALRRLFLYGNLAGFLGPLAANAFGLLKYFFSLVLDLPARPSPAEPLVAIAVLALLGLYHDRIRRADARLTPEQGLAATVRRLAVFGFSGAGLAMFAIGLVNLIGLILNLLSGDLPAAPDFWQQTFSSETSRLVIGLGLWLIFWRAARQLFSGPSEEERDSALRKFYLYLVVFVAVLLAVSNATVLLAGFLRRILGLEVRGQAGNALAAIITMAVVWAYHALVLRGDAAQVREAPRQAGIRRLYWYLVAGVGLGAVLIGLSGLVSVLIRGAFGSTSLALREQLAWFTSALVAGLPVWFWPWRQAQGLAMLTGEAGTGERRSVVRKIYLYFFLFVATITVLSAAIFILSRLLSLALGEPVRGDLANQIAQAAAFTLIALGVWLYHGRVLRDDGRLARAEQAGRLAAFKVVVVDGGRGQLGQALLQSLRRELPEVALTPVGLTPEAEAAMSGEASPAPVEERLMDASLIVGSWEMALDSVALAAAIAASPARKVLLPVWREGWAWAGVERWPPEALVQQAVHSLKLALAGEEIKPARPLSAGQIIGIIVGGLIALLLLGIPVMSFFF